MNRKNAGSHEQKNEIKTVPPQDQKDNIRKHQKAKKEKSTPAMADKFKSEDGDGKSAQQQQKDEPVTAKSKNDAKAKDDANNAKSVAFDKKASSPAALVDDKFKEKDELGPSICASPDKEASLTLRDFLDHNEESLKDNEFSNNMEMQNLFAELCKWKCGDVGYFKKKKCTVEKVTPSNLIVARDGKRKEISPFALIHLDHQDVKKEDTCKLKLQRIGQVSNVDRPVGVTIVDDYIYTVSKKSE